VAMIMSLNLKQPTILPIMCAKGHTVAWLLFRFQHT